MPRRLRPKTELAADAILVGDPGRALLLAQELLAEPKMSNHARGLWGYTDRTPAGEGLTIQATGMGGPSAALVLADLAKLGVRRVVRVGTCVAGKADLGELLLPTRAIAVEGSAAAFGLQEGAVVEPNAELLDRLREEVEAQDAVIASLDTLDSSIPSEAIAADMQTVAVFARARQLGMAAAAILVVHEADGVQLDDDALDDAAKRAGLAAMRGLGQAPYSNPQVES